VKDILPAGVVLSGTIDDTLWQCSVLQQAITCNSPVNHMVAPGAYFPDIIVPVVTYPIVTVSANPTVSQYIPKDAKAVKVGSINI
jgi:hypothetical protein